MDLYWDSLDSYTSMSNDHPYLPEVDEPVWILGKKRSSVHDRDAICEDIRSRLWFTYRKDFPPIGDSDGPTSDTGWGCMHRCGQMLIGQALLQIHLGRDWIWSPDRVDQPYLRILKMFEDRPTSAPYSIHEITLKSATGGNPPDSWLGPNAVAHAIKKIAAFDTWSNLVVYITTEDGVVVQEIKKLCFLNPDDRRKCALRAWRKDGELGREEASEPSSSPSPFVHFLPDAYAAWNSETPVMMHYPIFNEVDDDCVEIFLPTPTDDACIPVSLSPPKLPSSAMETPQLPTTWHPLLLVVPLRLGLHEFNTRYVAAIKGLFKLPQCVGIIGGRPNHALWFIGYVGDSLLCLDPHTTQPAARLGQPFVEASSYSSPTSSSLDGSFHTCNAVRLPFNRLDPSLAVAFVCTSEADFDELRVALAADVLSNRLSPPIFEVHDRRPHNLPPTLAHSALLTPKEWSDLYTPEASVADPGSVATSTKGGRCPVSTLFTSIAIFFLALLIYLYV